MKIRELPGTVERRQSVVCRECDFQAVGPRAVSSGRYHTHDSGHTVTVTMTRIVDIRVVGGARYQLPRGLGRP